MLICVCGFNLEVNNILIYKDPLRTKSSRNSYFGFSVILYSGSKDSKPWIQIGAPRGNDTRLPAQVTEPGVIFRCPFAEPCYTLKIDNTGNGAYGKNCKTSYVQQINNAWIGGSMAIEPNEKAFVVCGHRWKDRITDRKFDYMTGICYWQDIISGTTKKMLPLNTKREKLLGQYYTEVNGSPLFNYGIGQAGFSIHFLKSETLSELLIGAPGILNWKGSTVLYKYSSVPDSCMNVDVVRTEKVKDIKYLGLFGYQVNSGKFLRNKKLYIAGSPRSYDLKGSVFLYEHKTLETNFNVTKVILGETNGEYFGSSIAVADINNDGLDDMIVGAPLYTTNYDEGCIYVFSANSQPTIFDINPIRIEGRKSGARFGTTLAALGDLDQDGYADIAVGAPYENENTGAIYIYSGGQFGLTLSQKITAKEIYPDLRGFGISFSQPADMDMNKYNDIAVGAYMSGHVLIFRTKPVVYLKTFVYSNIQLKESDTNFNITVCLSYDGEHVPETLNVHRTISVDEKYQRAFLFGNSTKNITIAKISKCEDVIIILKTNEPNRNIYDPITITVKQELVIEEQSRTLLFIEGNSFNKGNDKFNKSFPAVNEKLSSSVREVQVSFSTECGNDNICDAELHMNTNFSGLINGTYIIGSKSDLKLNISLTNNGEPAYMADINITIPLEVHLANGIKICQETLLSHGLQLICNIDNPLKKGTIKPLTLHFDMHDVKPGTHNLTFNISATTKSKDKNLHLNSQMLPLYLTTDAKVVITGKSEEAVYSYYKTSETFFSHTYTVQKQGLSPIEVAEINFKVPVIWQDLNGTSTKLVEIFNPKAYLNKQPLLCSSEINYHSEDIVPENEFRSKRDVSKMHDEAVYYPPTNRTLYINCSTSNVVCADIMCIAGPFDSYSTSSASVKIKMILNISELNTIMGKKDIVHLSTIGSVSIKDAESSQHSTRSQMIIVSTSFYNTTFVEAISKPVATWIIALSIIAGILLLMFLVIGLMKAGFFERRKKDELKALRAVDAMNEFTVEKIQNKKYDSSDKEEKKEEEEEKEDEEEKEVK